MLTNKDGKNNALDGNFYVSGLDCVAATSRRGLARGIWAYAERLYPL